MIRRSTLLSDLRGKGPIDIHRLTERKGCDPDAPQERGGNHEIWEGRSQSSVS